MVFKKEGGIQLVFYRENCGRNRLLFCDHDDSIYYNVDPMSTDVE